MAASPDSADERLGANVRFLRERLDMSQAELARRMSALGIPWHQSTVARAEAGRQPVRASEAEGLARILGVTIDRLLWASVEAKEAALASDAIGRLRRDWREAAGAVARLIAALSSAERARDRAAGSEWPRVRDMAAGLAEEIDDCTLEAALDEGAAIFERESNGGD